MSVLTQKDGKALKTALRELCAGSDELRMLVGFFYFSGVKALYEALVANPQLKLRVLVGTDVECVMGRVVECVFAYFSVFLVGFGEGVFKDFWGCFWVIFE